MIPLAIPIYSTYICNASRTCHEEEHSLYENHKSRLENAVLKSTYYHYFIIRPNKIDSSDSVARAHYLIYAAFADFMLKSPHLSIFSEEQEKTIPLRTSSPNIP